MKNPVIRAGFKDHKESPKYQIHDKEQVIALSPEEEADFRQNLENLLQELDTEKENFEKTEERKIEDFEGRKNLYLDHAEQMAAKTRGNFSQNTSNSKFTNNGYLLEYPWPIWWLFDYTNTCDTTECGLGVGTKCDYPQPSITSIMLG